MPNRSLLAPRGLAIVVGLILFTFGLWLTLAPFEVTRVEDRTPFEVAYAALEKALESGDIGDAESTEYMFVVRKWCGPPIYEWLSYRWEWGWGKQSPSDPLSPNVSQRKKVYSPCRDDAKKRAVPGTAAGLLGIGLLVLGGLSGPRGPQGIHSAEGVEESGEVRESSHSTTSSSS